MTHDLFQMATRASQIESDAKPTMTHAPAPESAAGGSHVAAIAILVAPCPGTALSRWIGRPLWPDERQLIDAVLAGYDRPKSLALLLGVRSGTASARALRAIKRGLLVQVHPDAGTHLRRYAVNPARLAPMTP